MARADLDGRAFLERLDEQYMLPSLSPVVVALIELAARDQTSVGEIAELIAKDPSLTARVLKLANSAFYRTRYPAATVLQSVTRIGVRQTRLFALSVSLKEAFPLKRGGAIDYGRFWRLCLYQGVLARWLARKLHAGDPEEAFTAGLLLEIGLLALTRVYKHGSVALQLTYPLTSLLATEEEVYGVHHRQIGETLLRSWRFPERIVACQQSFACTGTTNGVSDLASVCAIAGALSACICEPQVDLGELFGTVEVSFGLARSVIAEAVSAALENVCQIAGAFDVPVDSTKDTIALIEKANLALARLASTALEPASYDLSVMPDSFSAPKPVKDDATTNLGTARQNMRSPVHALGRFARRLAKMIDPATREGTYVRVIMSQTERLERALSESDDGSMDMKALEDETRH